MSGTEEASAPGPAAPRFRGFKFPTQCWKFCSAMATAVVLDARPAEARIMSANIVQPSVCFPNIFPTFLWFAGAMFAAAGVFRLHQVVKGDIDDPARIAAERRGWRYIFIGTGCAAFTFIQSYLASPEYLCSLRQQYCPKNPDAWDQAPFLWEVIAYFWFVSFSFFSFAEYFFRAARKSQDASAAQIFKGTAARLITAGVTALAAPALLLMLAGGP